MAHTGPGEMTIARAEHEIVEAQITRQHVSLFIVVMLVRGKQRARLRANEERDARLLNTKACNRTGPC